MSVSIFIYYRYILETLIINNALYAYCIEMQMSLCRDIRCYNNVVSLIYDLTTINIRICCIFNLVCGQFHKRLIVQMWFCTFQCGSDHIFIEVY